MKSEYQATIRRLQIEDDRIAKRRVRLENRLRQLAEDEKRHQDSKEATVLLELRTSGVLQLPLAVVLERVRSLAGVLGADEVASGHAEPNGSEAGKPNASPGGSKTKKGSAADGREVIVAISRNVSVDNRACCAASRAFIAASNDAS
jgi:hypothetical protein